MILYSCNEMTLGSARRVWLVAVPSDVGPLTAAWLQERGVPPALAAPGQWAHMPYHSGASLMLSTRAAQDWAHRCPGVVLCGTDLRAPGQGWAEELWTWLALPGPQTPKLEDAAGFNGRRPTAEDGAPHAFGNKVAVWAFRRNAPNQAVPLGYHPEAGVFDDADIPGLEVIAWAPLAPRSTPHPAGGVRPVRRCR